MAASPVDELLPMRILLVNPNITEAITETMAVEARRCASSGTVITPVTAAFGTQYIANRAEAAIAGHAVLDAIATYGEDADAVIVAAFADPGLAAAKELFARPPARPPAKPSCGLSAALAARHSARGRKEALKSPVR